MDPAEREIQIACESGLFTAILNGRRITLIVEPPKPELPVGDTPLVFAVLNCDYLYCNKPVGIRDADQPNSRRFCSDAHRYAQNYLDQKLSTAGVEQEPSVPSDPRSR